MVQYNASRYLSRVDRAARTLSAAGFEVVLVAIKDDETPAFEQRPGYTVRRVELKSDAGLGGRGLRVSSRRSGGPIGPPVSSDADIYNPRDIYPLLVSWAAAKMRRSIYVYDSDELNLYRNWPWARRRWWKLLAKSYEGYFIRRSAANITSDEGRADILVETYGIPRPTVVRNVPERIESVQRDDSFRAAAIGDARTCLSTRAFSCRTAACSSSSMR